LVIRWGNTKNWSGLLLILTINALIALLVVLFICQQLIYDGYLKEKLPVISALSIAVGYAIRYSVAYYFFNFTTNSHMVAIGVTIFSFAFYSAIQWRIAESRFINYCKLKQKPGGNFFSSIKAETLLRIIFWVFAIVSVIVATGVFNVAHLPLLFKSIVMSGLSLVFILIPASSKWLIPIFPIFLFIILSVSDLKTAAISTIIVCLIIYTYVIKMREAEREYFGQ